MRKLFFTVYHNWNMLTHIHTYNCWWYKISTDVENFSSFHLAGDAILGFNKRRSRNERANEALKWTKPNLYIQWVLCERDDMIVVDYGCNSNWLQIFYKHAISLRSFKLNKLGILEHHNRKFLNPHSISFIYGSSEEEWQYEHYKFVINQLFYN